MKIKSHAMAALLLSIAGSSALFQSVQAGQAIFTDQSRDLILSFRKTGNDGGSVSPVVIEVDLGQASIYYGAAYGSSIPITAYGTSTQMGLLDSFNDLSWSVGGCVPNTGDSGDPSKPINTLWVTEPRQNPDMQSSPAWQRASKSQLGLAGGKINSILNNAATWAASAPADSVTNTATAAAIPYGNVYNANGSLGGNGNYLGYFQGVVENTTPSAFIYDGSPSRSDLYELQPGSGSGTYLGYFELGTDGSMTFYAPSATVTYPAPTLSVAPDGLGNVTISFQSTSGGTYTLYSTSAGNLTPFSTSSWTQVTSLTGDGSVDQFPAQTISGTGTIYAVTVH